MMQYVIENHVKICKIHLCILHASTSPSLTHARPRVWRW